MSTRWPLCVDLTLDLSSSSAYGTKCGQRPPGSRVDYQIRYLFPAIPPLLMSTFDCLLPICTRLAWTSSVIYQFPVGSLSYNSPWVHPHDMFSVSSLWWCLYCLPIFPVERVPWLSRWLPYLSTKCVRSSWTTCDELLPTSCIVDFVIGQVSAP